MVEKKAVRIRFEYVQLRSGFGMNEVTKKYCNKTF